MWGCNSLTGLYHTHNTRIHTHTQICRISPLALPGIMSWTTQKEPTIRTSSEGLEARLAVIMHVHEACSHMYHMCTLTHMYTCFIFFLVLYIQGKSFIFFLILYIYTRKIFWGRKVSQISRFCTQNVRHATPVHQLLSDSNNIVSLIKIQVSY